ncbi:MAG: hypothetical protein ABIR66_00080 [Saprospiraceae bacterium]
MKCFLWTDENKPLDSEYELSPLNYELPILVPNDQGTFLGWSPGTPKGPGLARYMTTI